MGQEQQLMQGHKLTSTHLHTRTGPLCCLQPGQLLAAATIPENLKPLILKCQVEEIKISTEHAADPSSEMGSWYCNVNLFAPAVDSTDTCGKKISLASLQRSRAEINGNCEGCLPLHAMHALKLWPPATLKLNIVVLSSFRPLISNVKREKKLVLGLEERLKYSGQHML